ncbi:hypothetical protein [Streptomyces umbrinus]
MPGSDPDLGQRLILEEFPVQRGQHVRRELEMARRLLLACQPAG